MCAELFLEAGEDGVLPQTGCNLSVVFNHEQAEVAVALLEHEVICLPYLFGGGTEGEPGIGKAKFGEGGVGAFLMAFFFGLGSLDVGHNGGGPRGVVGRHD